ncbi:hypothetical protein EVAR_85249_1 [Eumeta japonica]|uniref:Uncharacterized protein n=1 Tax=Eumeta variegata TaxID=151549 RepID=A0A4C1W209_EUMVA|nr:hypothetical protein EVAR_85249_1 [Eumeta japonica]
MRVSDSRLTAFLNARLAYETQPIAPKAANKNDRWTVKVAKSKKKQRRDSASSCHAGGGAGAAGRRATARGAILTTDDVALEIQPSNRRGR